MGSPGVNTSGTVVIDASCSPLVRVVTHELFHVLGRLHEHQRQDRDYYVKIMWDNILDGEPSWLM